ncbi:MAG: RNA polymerase-associated protein RapA, partial [Oligoflexales bacterium]|nr:RNA polymerase-associated protein RapA [Oligoflexales bacterium]
ESLIHQWVAEMFRRFGQLFSVIDEDRCEGDIRSHGVSAFGMNQFVIVAMEFFLNHENRYREALAVDWDLIIVDEAHHLRWTPEGPDVKWRIAEALSRKTRGLLLLTATPQQKGIDTQFGLLNLVDPERFCNFDLFLIEHERMSRVAEIAASLSREGLTEDIKKRLVESFEYDNAFVALLNSAGEKDLEKILKSLIDRHGTGRVLFRNRREKLKGFPKRVLFPVKLKPPQAYLKKLRELDPDTIDDMILMDIATGRKSDRVNMISSSGNTKYKWLVDFTRNLGREKAIVICQSYRQVLELSEFLEKTEGIKASIFHENMSVVDRDREAARFVNQEGSSLLISSEIGGEGRNFQFTNKLVLMDLPKHPDLLEQRIGRLDRIGQKREIEIYVPWLQGTPEEVLFYWYHEGLSAFEYSLNGISILLEEYVERLFEAFIAYLPESQSYFDRKNILNELVADTARSADELRDANRQSVDLLIDMNSFNGELGGHMVEMIDENDDDTSIEFFIRSMFDHYGVNYEEYDNRGSLIVRPDSLMFIEQFPGFEGCDEITVTFDREIGLKREDITFLSCDHPIVESSLNLLIERNEGIASICKWVNSPQGYGAIIELSVVLEVAGPKHLGLGRYLPISVKEFVFNHQGKPVKEHYHKNHPTVLSELSSEEIPPNLDRVREFLEPIVAKALDKSRGWTETKVAVALKTAKKELEGELDRLRAMAQINPNITPVEISELEKKQEEVLSHLRKASPRLDGIRLIFTR